MVTAMQLISGVAAHLSGTAWRCHCSTPLKPEIGRRLTTTAKHELKGADMIPAQNARQAVWTSRSWKAALRGLRDRRVSSNSILKQASLSSSPDTAKGAIASGAQ
ncbi:hypothetical protein N657DRAFT_205225 [Parathielavia appendiculata]|uniref:Uncharacterized protein n=1 Tax=Parathielavia appendiculata TaxID=2587402 RepID=A0AAN6U793_9PEZI|nr:hypothetical protein N657DRAFT_205225 [Parathielavia appendiculata]